jgi:tetratricopeptide (TPR) repeat protein
VKAILITALLAAPAAAARPEIESELVPIVDLFYDLDFDRAGAAVDALESRRPGHPAPPFYRAVVHYQRWIAEGMGGDGQWSAVERQLDAAQAAAEALLKTDPASGHYYLGATKGFRARGLAARKRFAAALPSAVSAVKHLKTALALDPSLEDARLGLGMYHYFAERMPAGAKPVAYLLIGEGGDRKKGLEELWRVANSTGAARMEARSVLSMILAKDDEADYEGSERLLVELATRYPRNPIYRLRRVFVAQKRGDHDAAIALADAEGKWPAALHPSIRPLAQAWARYRTAESHLLHGRHHQAEPFLARLETAPLPKGLRDWVIIRRGNLLDAEGRREEALAQYRRVEDRRAKKAAKAFVKDPYPRGPREPAPFFTGY